MRATTENGYVIQVDDEDAHLLKSYKWRAYKNRNTTVVTARLRSGNRDVRLSLSRLIAEAKPGQWVWHLNGDPLDARRINLKVMHRPTGRKMPDIIEEAGGSNKCKTGAGIKED